MTSRQARRLLIVAFAISLLVHLIFAISVRQHPNEQEGPTEVVSIQHRSAITRMATPPPRPKITPVPHPTPAPRPAATRAAHGNQPIKTGTGTSGTASPVPTPQPTAVAVATGANGCAKGDTQAAVIESPPLPDVPVSARAEGTSGIALIDVRLDAQGNVTTAAIKQSTGNNSLDLVAVGMARDARYSPALHDCKPIAATYSYSVKFVAW